MVGGLPQIVTKIVPKDAPTGWSSAQSRGVPGGLRRHHRQRHLADRGPGGGAHGAGPADRAHRGGGSPWAGGMGGIRLPAEKREGRGRGVFAFVEGWDFFPFGHGW